MSNYTGRCMRLLLRWHKISHHQVTKRRGNVCCLIACDSRGAPFFVSATDALGQWRWEGTTRLLPPPFPLICHSHRLALFCNYGLKKWGTYCSDTPLDINWIGLIFDDFHWLEERANLTRYVCHGASPPREWQGMLFQFCDGIIWDNGKKVLWWKIVYQ